MFNLQIQPEMAQVVIKVCMTDNQRRLVKTTGFHSDDMKSVSTLDNMLHRKDKIMIINR